MNKLLFVTRPNCTNCFIIKGRLIQIANSENIQFEEVDGFNDSVLRQKYNLSKFQLPTLILVDGFGAQIKKWTSSELSVPFVDGGLINEVRQLNGGIFNSGNETPNTENEFPDIPFPETPIPTKSIPMPLILAALGIGAFLYFR